MADKIQKSYKSSQNFYDDFITHKKWWSKLYAKIIWRGVDNVKIANKLLDFIPNDFDGKLLEVPVGTGVFTYEKFNSLTKSEIFCLDYSEDMLEIANTRFDKNHIKILKGDVGNLPFGDEAFDIIVSMNGFHVFPDKDKAFFEVTRTLKKDGTLLACFYVKDRDKSVDFVAKSILSKKGFLTPPFDTEEIVKSRLLEGYEIEFLEFNGSIILYKAKKK